MRPLWKWTNQIFKGNSATGIFLGTNILCWTLAAFVLGVLMCTVMGIAALEYLSGIMCMAIYAGVIGGLFGGLLFLMRKDS